MRSSIGLLLSPDMARQHGFTLVDEAPERQAILYKLETVIMPLWLVTHGHFITTVTESEYVARLALEERREIKP